MDSFPATNQRNKQNPNNIQQFQSQHQSQHAVYDYIKKEIKRDIQHNFLKFLPESHEYSAFSELYKQCTEIIIKLIVNCTNDYYSQLLLLLSALLGFESAPFKCEIFDRPEYNKRHPQKHAPLKHVEVRMMPQTNSPYQHQRRRSSKNKFNDQHNTPFQHQISNCQLSAIDIFYGDLPYFKTLINSTNKSKKIGIYDLQQLLLIFYNCSKYAKLDVAKQFEGQNLYRLIRKWVDNLDEISFKKESNGDDLSDFSNLFIAMDDIFDKFMKKTANKEADVLDVKLLFVYKMLQCPVMNRRVQSLSLLKIILEKARSDDNKSKNNNEANEWSTKSKNKQKYAGQSRQSMTISLREHCCRFVLNDKIGILELLMSPNYIHENLISKLQPIIDVLCECKQINFSVIHLLWRASENTHSVELRQFNALYLSLSKQLPPNLCKQFYQLIHQRFDALKSVSKIEESHIDFCAQFTSNYIDRLKNYKNVSHFEGITFLKQYAIGLNETNIRQMHLRKIAFSKMQIILQKQCMKGKITTFILQALSSMALFLQHQMRTGGVSADLTYLIEGVHELLRTKQVGRNTDIKYTDIADAVMNDQISTSWIDLMVVEVEYWFWLCSPANFDGSKRWKTKTKQQLKLRFDFIKMIAEKTAYRISVQNVNDLTNIPTSTNRNFSGVPNCADFISQINDIHHRQLKLWLDECVKLNRATDILDQQAIKNVFQQQFDLEMDMAAFKSWLTYFHELNKDIYDIERGEYYDYINPQNAMGRIAGFRHMWDVIYSSHHENVVIAVTDEVIKIAQQQECRQNMSHLPMSAGFSKLFGRYTEQFEKYKAKIKIHQDKNGQTIAEIGDKKDDFRMMRVCLVLRRVMEYSIGKKWKREKGKSTNKYCVVYRLRNGRERRNNYNQRRDSKNKTRTMEVVGYVDSRMTHIRDKLVNELQHDGNPRQIVLFRRYKDRFVMIEEHSLPYLSFCDLANKKKIELEVEIIAPRDFYSYQSELKSISAEFATKYKQFTALHRLLVADLSTISLSAYYVLRYLPPNEQFMYDLIEHCKSEHYFHGGRPLWNIYNIDVIRHFLSMQCMTDQERVQQRKMFKAMFSRDVFGKLFKLFTDCKQFDLEQDAVSSIFKLLWLERFNRLCLLFYDVRIPENLYKNQRHNRSYRVVRNYLHKSDEIMETLMHGLYVLLNANIPKQQLSYFDITDPKRIESVIQETICKCFHLINYVIINKLQNFLRDSQGNTNDREILENIFLDGLQKAVRSTLACRDSFYKRTIREALYQGIEHFMEHDANLKYIQRILGILMEDLHSDTAHSPKFLKLLTKLMRKDTSASQKFIPSLLDFIFTQLRKQTASNKNHALSLLADANLLYRLLESGSREKENVPLSRIDLLMNKCLFGSPNQINENLLCPSGTKERKEALNLLFAIIGNDDDERVQTKLLDHFLLSINKHLYITTANTVITEEDRIFDADDKKQSADEADNRRNDFVGLVMLKVEQELYSQ